jgi:hypothetical protein
MPGAIRFTSNTLSGDKTTVVPATSDFTCCCFVKPTAGDPFETIFMLTSGVNASAGVALYFNSDHWELYNDNALGTLLISSPVGLPGAQWYFVAVTYVGASTSLYWKQLGGGTCNVLSASTSSFSFTPAAFVVAQDLAAESLVGQMDGLRFWTGVGLTQAELETESEAIEPARTADIWADWRFESDLDLRDRARSNVLAVTTSAADQVPDTGAPIADYRRRRRTRFAPVSNVLDPLFFGCNA